MELQVALEHRAQVEEFQRKHRIGLLTLLFTDIVGSTQLKQHWGDVEALAMIQRHHALVRGVLARFKEAEEITTAGDSFFLVFAKPSDSVKFALLMQAKLRADARETGHPLFDRIGIHVGEVFIEEGGAGPKPKDLYGIQVDACARIMSLGKENQVLMSRFAFDNARQVLKGQELEGVGALSWLNHGPYLLKGVEEPIEVCEVGELDESALTPPANSDKAQRCLSKDGEPVLGWRPAVGQVVPGTNWVLQEKLGEGGFGEVWLGRHEILKESKVFKFCFRADRVRSLKREVTLFRLLKERVGNHPNIIGVHEVYFDEPPYYIVMDYAGSKDLASWAATRGGLDKLSLAQRLEIVAQAAEGLEAAHGAGVIHRDIKPSNLLVFESVEGIHVKLTDFGVGQVVSAEALEGMTRMGFTQTMFSSGSSHTGTLLYMAPELIAGKPASPQSDIYSLGVLFYQLVVGDFARPLTMDWISSVEDQLLRDDLVRCFAGNPQDRFSSAGELAKSVRRMDDRRAAEAAKVAQIEVAKRRAYLLGLLRRAGLAVLVLAVLVSAFYLLREFQAAKHGKIIIQTIPDEAEVWLNGRQVGSTPYEAGSLTPGQFEYGVKLAGYQSIDLRTVVSPKETSRYVFSMTLMRPGLASNTLLITTNLTKTSKRISITEMEGAVEVAHKGTTNWQPASLEIGLVPGDHLRTGPGSAAVLRLKGSTVRVGERAFMELYPDSESEHKVGLWRGILYLFSREKPETFEIRTPTATARVRG